MPKTTDINGEHTQGVEGLIDYLKNKIPEIRDEFESDPNLKLIYYCFDNRDNLYLISETEHDYYFLKANTTSVNNSVVLRQVKKDNPVFADTLEQLSMDISREYDIEVAEIVNYLRYCICNEEVSRRRVIAKQMLTEGFSNRGVISMFITIMESKKQIPILVFDSIVDSCWKV